MLNVPLSRLQTLVGLMAGVVTIAGAVFSSTQLFKPATGMGEVRVLLRDAKSEKPVSNATIEILTPENALVTTLTSSSSGQARHALPQGPYRLRVSHTRFAAEVRQIHVLSGQTAEVRVRLHAGASSPLAQTKRAVTEGVSSLRRLLGL